MVYANLHILEHKDRIAQTQADLKEGSYFGSCYGKREVQSIRALLHFLTLPSDPYSYTAGL